MTLFHIISESKCQVVSNNANSRKRRRMDDDTCRWNDEILFDNHLWKNLKRPCQQGWNQGLCSVSWAWLEDAPHISNDELYARNNACYQNQRVDIGATDDLGWHSYYSCTKAFWLQNCKSHSKILSDTNCLLTFWIPGNLILRLLRVVITSKVS